MSMTDPIADMLVRIKNALAVRKPQVSMPASKLKLAIANVLRSEGYIGDVRVTGEGAKAKLEIALKYYEGKPVIERLDRISKPSLRIYKASDELPRVLAGLGVAIISTSQGMLSDRKARAAGQGGEVVCIVA